MIPDGVFSRKDAPQYILNMFMGWAWDKLFRAEFVKEHGLFYQEQRTTNDMLFVFNRSRPLTRDAQSAVGILREIEAACGLPFTGVVHNTNLGRETTPETVLSALPVLTEICEITGLPLRFTAARRDIAALLPINIGEIFPMELQKTIW